jgi:hypothetical protein
MKRFSTGCGLLLLLLLAFVCYRVLTMRPRQPRLVDLPVAEQKRRRADAERLVKQVESVARRVRHGDTGAWTLTASSEQLNTLLQDRFKIEGVPVQDLGIEIDPGQLAVTGTTQYKGFNVPMQLSGTIETPGGGLNFVAQPLSPKVWFRHSANRTRASIK